MTDLTGLDLTRQLVAFDTITPPGHEFECATFLAEILEPSGFKIELHDWQSRRPNLIATLAVPKAEERDATVFSGHLDTFPPGQADWSVDPFAVGIRDGRLYGRGTSDMTSGVAACDMAGLALTRKPVRRTEIRLILGAMRGFDFGIALHPVTAGPSLNVGKMTVGRNMTSVPEFAHVGVDIRLIVGQLNARIKAPLANNFNDDVAIVTLTDVDHVFADLEPPWIQPVFSVVEYVSGTAPEVGTATYFADASVLRSVMGSRDTMNMGPGAMANQTDEYCETAPVNPSIEVFTRLGQEHIA